MRDSSGVEESNYVAMLCLLCYAADDAKRLNAQNHAMRRDHICSFCGLPSDEPPHRGNIQKNCSHVYSSRLPVTALIPVRPPPDRLIDPHHAVLRSVNLKPLLVLPPARLARASV